MHSYISDHVHQFYQELHGDRFVHDDKAIIGFCTIGWKNSDGDWSPKDLNTKMRQYRNFR
jgi:acetyl-CoA carboxylase alpha subunit